MKKNAFTLAEVLITLSMIGVIASLTLPTLLTNVSKSQVGPKLAKAVAVFEQGNKALLSDNNIGRLTDLGIIGSGAQAYVDELSQYTYLTKDRDYTNVVDSNITDRGEAYISNNGIVYLISTGGTLIGFYSARNTNVGEILIDINGTKGPNQMADDIFVFNLMDNGSMVPKGSSFNYNNDSWSISCKAGEKPNDPETCAGHILENNLRVLYK